MYYRSVHGEHPCTTFQGVTAAASLQTYGTLMLGKHTCSPKSRIEFKRPWALTQDTTVISSPYLSTLQIYFQHNSDLVDHSLILTARLSQLQLHCAKPTASSVGMIEGVVVHSEVSSVRLLEAESLPSIDNHLISAKS